MSSKSDKKKPLVPSLRFPEFREAGAWEVKRLGDVCVIRTGKKDANEGHENGIYPFFTCAENHIYSNSHSFDCEAILVAGNANVGQTKHYRGKFEAYQRTYVLTDFSDINTQYLYSYLGGNLQNDMALQVQTSAMSYIKLPMLKNYKVPAPRNPTEQQKIAHCLSSLDEVIGLQAKKVQSLKQHKKGLMQQLFPAEGETTPRLRFPEFREAGAWEVKELIKLAGRGTERNQKGKIKRVLTNSAEYG
ncbi:restriction endonuclease subunit S, partial [Thiolapillus sp.]|uniref:restriction endonuclease subunit S n=3 Tax=Thiolapillus sp. TaxID=2017437 RepID=UPI003AF4ABF4